MTTILLSYWKVRNQYKCIKCGKNIEEDAYSAAICLHESKSPEAYLHGRTKAKTRNNVKVRPSSFLRFNVTISKGKIK